MGRTCSAYWDLCLSQKAANNDYSLLFALTEHVVLQGVGCSALGDPSKPNGHPAAFSFPCSSDSRAWHLLHKLTCECEVGWKGMHLLTWADTSFHSPPSLKVPSAWWWKGRGSIASCEADGKWVSLSHGSVALPVNLFFRVPNPY